MNALRNIFVLVVQVNNNDDGQDATAASDTLHAKIESDLLQPLEEILEQTLNSKMGGCVLRQLGNLLRELSHKQVEGVIDGLKKADKLSDSEVERLRNK